MAFTPPVEPQAASRKGGTCRKCSKPMKGHRSGQCDELTDETELTDEVVNKIVLFILC